LEGEGFICFVFALGMDCPVFLAGKTLTDPLLMSIVLLFIYVTLFCQ
jgi:hypothetical protein